MGTANTHRVYIRSAIMGTIMHKLHVMGVKIRKTSH